MTTNVKLTNHATGSDMMDAAGVLRAAGKIVANPKWLAMYVAVTMAEASIEMIAQEVDITEVDDSLSSEAIRAQAKDYAEDMLHDLKQSIYRSLDDPQFVKSIVNAMTIKKYNGVYGIDDIELSLEFDFKNCR